MAADVIPLHGERPVRLSQDDTAVRTHALAAVECVWCEAQPGEPCTRTDALGARHETRLLHQCRITTARKQLEGH
ncbi:hypothetical protein GV792_04850 [Nocardia cyriacigeorgica]|uniref:zinc finger domain-containing protein n=1 Tax=Nocardia cyriacigeorgica TaxID=135487 RepID=UPI0013BCB1C5|nr:hypothetical protein [Nocardia cyriacigeorgica]NEW49372.1 hypothetical protein [Nocardia cyriacigeorgica]